MTHRRPLASTVADLWRSSALIQGIMALTRFFTICYLALASQPIPEILAALVGSIIGYYFGTKLTHKE